MYHKIAPINRRSTLRGHYVHPGMFERQLKALKLLKFSSVQLGTLYDNDWPSRGVILTFDDGYTNFIDSAVPKMVRLGISGTVFMVSGQVGGTNEWDVKNGDVSEPLMTQAQLRECVSKGMEVGSHTIDHVHLDQLPLHELRRQLMDSKAQLEAIVGVPITTLCYPYGRQNEAVRSMAKEAGYRVATSTKKGPNFPNTDRFELRRVNIRSDTLLPVFVSKLWRATRHDR